MREDHTWDKAEMQIFIGLSPLWLWPENAYRCRVFRSTIYMHKKKKKKKPTYIYIYICPLSCEVCPFWALLPLVWWHSSSCIYIYMHGMMLQSSGPKFEHLIKEFISFFFFFSFSFSAVLKKLPFWCYKYNARNRNSRRYHELDNVIISADAAK